MSRYIDADALNDTMYHEAFENNDSYDERNPMARWDSGLWIRYKLFENCLENAPTIDAVSVVRCRDCKHSSGDGTYGCMCNHFNDNDWAYHRMYADDFCSYGEREVE